MMHETNESRFGYVNDDGYQNGEQLMMTTER